MDHARMLSTRSMLRARAGARRGLLASAAATIAVAVATVSGLLARLAIEVGRAGELAPPGVPPADAAVQVERGIVALLSAAPALVLLVVMIAATAAAQLARLLAAAREEEAANLRARGLSRRQAAAANAIESAIVAVIGAVVGLALAALLLAGSSAREWPAALGGLWWVGAATAAVLGLVLVLASRSRATASGRGARATTAVAVALVVLAAAFVLWQLRRAQPTAFDPIVAVAPTVVLLAGALVALAVFGAGAAAWAIPAASRPGLAPSYPSRQVARRLQISAVAVLLVGLTVAQAVFASAYSATWTAMATDSAALRAGADLRVDLQPAAATPAVVADAASVDGVDAAAPALVAPVEIGSTDAELIAVPTAAIGTIVTDAGGLVDRRELASALTPADGSVTAQPVALGPGATGIRLTATIASSRAGVARTVSLRAIVRDATGAAAPLRLEGAAVDQPDGSVVLAAEAPLPAGTAPWDIVAVTASVPSTFGAATVVIDLTAAEVLGAGPLEIAGGATLDQGALEQVVWLADATPEADEPAAVRAVVSAALAETLGLGLGDLFEFRYAGSGRRGAFIVGGIVEAVPGASRERAVFAPMEVLDTSMLQRGTSIVAPPSVWASGAPAADVALSAALGGLPVATSAPGVTATVVGALVAGWWIATAGSAVLALIAAFAIVQTLTLARRRELGVLRALGVPPARQARLRAAELSAVLGAAVALGAAAGAGVAVLLVPDLVRAVTPGIVMTGAPVTLAWPGLVVAVGGLVVGLAAIVSSATVRVGRAALGATVGEDAR